MILWKLYADLIECLWDTRVYTSNHLIENRTNTWQPVIIRDTSYSTTSIDRGTFPIEHLTSVGILQFNPNRKFFPFTRAFFFSRFPRIFVHRFSISETFLTYRHLQYAFNSKMCWYLNLYVEPVSQHTDGSGKSGVYENRIKLLEWRCYLNSWLNCKSFCKTKRLKWNLKTLWNSCIQLEWEFIEFRLSKIVQWSISMCLWRAIAQCILHVWRASNVNMLNVHFGLTIFSICQCVLFNKYKKLRIGLEWDYVAKIHLIRNSLMNLIISKSMLNLC